jgi:hypothetical protein
MNCLNREQLLTFLHLNYVTGMVIWKERIVLLSLQNVKQQCALHIKLSPSPNETLEIVVHGETYSHRELIQWTK